MSVDNDIASDDDSVPAALFKNAFLEAGELIRSQRQDECCKLRINDKFSSKSFHDFFVKSRHRLSPPQVMKVSSEHISIGTPDVVVKLPERFALM